MSALAPRDYQVEAIDAAVAAWGRGVAGPAEVLPTGAGKTVVMAHLAKRWLGGDHGQRMVLLAHRPELLTQAMDKLHKVDPSLSVGMVQGTRNEARADVVCAMVQTLGRSENRRLMIPDVGLLMIDEAHHAVASTYRATIDHYVSRGAKLLGMTATMGRADDKVLGDVWTEVVYHKSIAWMIARGYLVRPRGVHVRVENLDLGKVKSVGGDYGTGALGAALEASVAPEAIAKAITEQCSDRQGIIFAPTVASAQVIATAVAEAGFSSAVIHGDLDKTLRSEMLEEFKAGKLQWLVNCMVLTEGTDLPCAAVCIIARPTASVNLFVQMVGRVLRPHPGKTEALILDVVGAIGKHRLMSTIDLFGDDSAEQRRELREAGIELDELGLDNDEVDAMERAEARDDETRYAGANGPLTFVEIDMFRGSAMDWVRTDAGVWFLPAGDRYIALIPGMLAHTWDIVAMDKTTYGTGRRLGEAHGDQGYARAQAESFVTPEEHMTAARDRSWKRKAATDSAKAYANRLGIEIAPGMRGSEIGQLLNQRLGTRRIDPRLPWYARGR